LTLNFRRNPIRALNQSARKFGELSYMNLGLTKFYLLTSPSEIKRILDLDHRVFLKGPTLQKWKAILGDGLISSEGELHHRDRRLMVPAFHKAMIASYAGVVSAETAKTMEGWKEDELMDVHREMANLTLTVVAQCLFSAEIGDELDPVARAMAKAVDHYDKMAAPGGKLIGKVLLSESRDYDAAERHLISVVDKIIAKRRASGKDEGDMLSMLFNAEKMGEGMMTDRQVRDETITFLLVGHETTAVLLTWTWYLLSMYPQAAEKLHAEVDGVLDGGRVAAYEDIPRLQYTNKVLTESLRIFPPIWAIGRRPIRAYKIGDYVIPANSMIMMSQIVNHHDPRYYKHPEAFDPDRWTPEMKAKLPKYSYFPFGGGPRTCIGEPFAWMEGTLILASIARRWRLEHDPSHRVVLSPKITLRPKDGMWMRGFRRPSR
jgi:cytochrome P450